MQITAGTRAASARAALGVLVAALLAAGAVTTSGDTDAAGLRSGPAPDLAGEAFAALGTGDPGSELEPTVAEPPATPAPASGDRRVDLDPAAAESAGDDGPRPGKPLPDGGADPTTPQADPDTLLVTFADGTSQAAIDATLAAAGVDGARLEGTSTVDPGGRADLTEALDGDPAVELVEPNLVRHATKVPNDPGRPTQTPWLNAVAAPTAWDAANMGAAATVAVLDSGVDLDHPDLAPNLVPGYDFVNNDAQPMDDNGHGTGVAGIIGAATQNGIGVAGVAWNARIMPIKVLDAEGNGTDAAVANGIRWAVSHGADVINLSLGGAGSSDTLRTAVEAAVAADVLVVAAAGNESTTLPSYPAAYPYESVLGVTATDNAGQFAWFSNHGWWVDIAAPGIDVHTTTLAPGTGVGTGSGTGTSFSSPIVAGVAALVVERHPTWSATTISRELTRTAKDVGPAGFDDTYGFGVVNAAAALGVAPTGAVSQPNLAGDAANLPTTARAIATGVNAAESLAYEYDDDWFSFTVPTAGGVTVTVTPPGAQAVGTRARELDPIVQVYGPGGGLVTAADDAFVGGTEVAQFNAAAGTHRIHVLNYLGSAGPSPYTVRVDVGQPPVSSFAEPASWATGELAGRPVVTDLDGDGSVETVVAAGSYLKILTQVAGAEPTVQEVPLLHALSLAQQPPFVGDLDGDGDLDVAVGVTTGIDVFWQDAGTFSAAVLYTRPGSGDTLLEGGQLDGAGPMEVVAGNEDGTDLVALRWNGTTFVPGPLFTRPDSSDFAVGDLTGDGRAEIVTFTSGWSLSLSAMVTVHLQQPNGTWALRQQFPMADYAQGFYDHAIGDVSGDGRNDLLLTSPEVGNTVPPLLSTFVQGTDGRLTLGVQAIAGTPHGVRIGDVTDDGRADAVLLHGIGGPGNPAVGVIRQNASGRLTFREEVVPWPGDSPYGIGIGDLSDDGLSDIAVTYPGGVRIVRQQQTATPAPEGPGPWFEALTPAPHATGVTTAVGPTLTFGRDVDASTVSSDQVWLVDARGMWQIPAEVTTAGRELTLHPGRPLTPGAPYMLIVDGVRDADGNPIFGTFTFTTAPAAAPPTYVVNSTYSPFPLDIDINGYDDVSWYTPSTALDPLWRFGPDGKWDDGTWNIQGTFLPVSGDFDGNGYEDVFWYSPGTGYDEMWFHGPPGADGFLARTRKAIPVNGTYVPVAGDFDRNGYDDIFWYGPGATSESLWTFGASGYTPVAQPAASGTTYRLAAGDFNRDGFDDIFWHLPGGGAESLWRGGAAAFTRLATTNVDGSYNLRAGDFTGDGFDDLYWWTTGTASLWRGGTAFTSQPAPVQAATARPVAGEFTGDGFDDLIAYVPGTTADRLLPGTPTGLG